MAEPLWTSHEACKATSGALVNGDWVATGVSIDTRTLNPGDLFVAIEGLARDGHDFLRQAADAGAVAALVSDPSRAEGTDLPLLVCDDALEGLNALGRAARSRTDARILAVTGSVGKTGTKETLRSALAPSGRVHASEASYNNLWGVPLSLARMPKDTEFGIFEIGMNHLGEITPLTRLVCPHIAIITTVAPVHLEFFKDVGEIALAKSEIFDGVVEGGAVLLNKDNAFFDFLSEKARNRGIENVHSFGETEDADIRLRRSKLHSSCSCVSADVFGSGVTYKVGIPGSHLVANSLAVLGAVGLAGADLAKAAMALGDLQAMKGRGERTSVTKADGVSFDVVDESYNANPASMKAALETLGGTRGIKGRRIAILGDMRELGETADRLHFDLADVIATAGIDRVYCCGQHMSKLRDALSPSVLGGHALISTDLVSKIKADVQAGDVFMIKGSLGTNMAPIVEALMSLGEEKKGEGG